MMDRDMLDSPPVSPCAKCKWVDGREAEFDDPVFWFCRHSDNQKLLYDPMTWDPYTVRKRCEHANPKGDCQLFELKQPEDEKPKKSLMGRICEMVFGR